MGQTRQLLFSPGAGFPVMLLLLCLDTPRAPLPPRLFELVGELPPRIQNMLPLPHLPGTLPAFLGLLPGLTLLTRFREHTVLETQGEQGATYGDKQYHDYDPECNHQISSF